MTRAANRRAGAETWEAWLQECERWRGRAITDGEMIDRLYVHYLADDTPLYALMALNNPPREGLQPIALPTHRALQDVEKAYLRRQWSNVGEFERQWSRRKKVLVIAGLALACWAIVGGAAWLVFH